MSETADYHPIKAVPNEVLSAILSKLGTKDLLHTVAVDRLWHSLSGRIIHKRLLDVASLPDNKLMLKCYHPSAETTTGFLECRYLNTLVRDRELAPTEIETETGATEIETVATETETRATDIETVATETETVAASAIMNSKCPGFADLRRLYSSFRPIMSERRSWLRFRWPGSVAIGSSSQADSSIDYEPATELVFLDDGERFSQLCVVTNVATPGSFQNPTSHHVTISDGVIRVFGDWLTRMASTGRAVVRSETAKARASTFSLDDPDVLWVDDAKTVGLRFRVLLGPSRQIAPLPGSQGGPPIVFKLIYEEILVQTSKLLLASEETTIPPVGQNIMIMPI